METKEEQMRDHNFPNSHRYLFLVVEIFCKWQVSVLSTEFFILPLVSLQMWCLFLN